ncbi:MAG: DNA-directed RNA polymerase subunit beta [Mycoplasmataceae bacterium]|nr:MAG: DNA-directed RNA polymerase subunit beta [Mycoplasmataceae bacterium]
MSHRLIISGDNQRREYFSVNSSPLFKDLPNKDFSQEQKKSYNGFKNSLKKLFDFYFPAKFSDYNNEVELKLEEIVWNDPQFTEDESKEFLVSYDYKIDLIWLIKWHCTKMQFRPEGDNLNEILENWIKQSFKIGKFSLVQLSDNQWKIETTHEKRKNQDYFKLLVNVTSVDEERIAVEFDCEQRKQIDFCSLPKINEQGNFIINGHEKVIVFQSVRSPGLYFFSDEENSNDIYGEIIPLKGPWVSLCYDSIKQKETSSVTGLKVKFLNSGVSINLFNLFGIAGLEFTSEQVEELFGQEEEIYNSFILGKGEEKKQIPPFLFKENNSYFLMGEVGRNKLDKKLNILSRIFGQKLAEDLFDKNGSLVLRKNSILSGDNFNIFKENFSNNNFPHVKIEQIENSENLFSFKIFSPINQEKIISILGWRENIQKKHFDVVDLLCSISYFSNIKNGIGFVEKEEDKDRLDNQIIRRVGDLIYNIFDNKLGSFLKNIDDKYLAYISQMKKADLLKIPNVRDFDKLVKNFFNSSTLIQLQNQNNPIAEASYARKVSVLGLGGFSSVNASLTVRNINPSYYGRYDLVETPEGQKVGLLHALSLNAEIDEFGQIKVPYFKVVDGVVINEIHYLSADQESDKYISHCNVVIGEDNVIRQDFLLARHNNEFVSVSPNKIDYIDSSFYHLNSVNSASIPFFQHNDSTRMLMACNMQKQAVVLLKNESPFVATGTEASLLNNSALNVFSENEGVVEYVDSKKIIVKEENDNRRIYDIKQFVVSNKNNLFLSLLQVKKGEKISKNQLLSYGNYGNKRELSLGHNLRVAFMSWNGYNFEDAIVVSDSLIKKDILTSFFVKKHIVIRKNTKYGEEVFSKDHLNKEKTSNLDDEGIIKLGVEVNENDILVGKITPEPGKKGETEELLLSNVFGDKLHNLLDSSFKLPWGEKGIVYAIKRRSKEDFEKIKKSSSFGYAANDLEILEIYVAQKRKLEIGDKLTTRFGNKGVIAKIVPEVDMPFDEEGNPVDIIFNPLSVPSRMNIGQLLETLLGLAAHKLGINFLVRTFNTPTKEEIDRIVKEADIKDYGLTTLYDGQTGLPFSHKVYVGYIYTIKLNHMVSDKFHARNTGPYSLIYQQPVKGRAQGGGQRVGEMEIWAMEAHGAAFNIMEMMGAKSDDLSKRKMINHSIIFNDRQVDLQSNQSESFNLLLQYLRGLGFDLEVTDRSDKKVNLYKFFEKS